MACLDVSRGIAGHLLSGVMRLQTPRCAKSWRYMGCGDQECPNARPLDVGSGSDEPHEGSIAGSARPANQ